MNLLYYPRFENFYCVSINKEETLDLNDNAHSYLRLGSVGSLAYAFLGWKRLMIVLQMQRESSWLQSENVNLKLWIIRLEMTND
jgi:hypothetical protein